MAQACPKMVVPSVPSMCSERRMPSPALRSMVDQDGAARLPRLTAQILAIKLQQIEGIEERLPRALAAHGSEEPIEVGHAIGTADHALAVDGDGSDVESEQRLGNHRRAIAVINTPAREHAHPVAVTAADEPEPVMLDLIDPLRPGRHGVRFRRQARRDKAGRMADGTGGAQSMAFVITVERAQRKSTPRCEKNRAPPPEVKPGAARLSGPARRSRSGPAQLPCACPLVPPRRGGSTLAGVVGPLRREALPHWYTGGTRAKRARKLFAPSPRILP